MRKSVKFSLIDMVLLAFILGGMAYFINRVSVDLEYKWEWSVMADYIFRYDTDKGGYVPGLLVKGLILTIKLSLWSSLLASLIGIVMGLMKISDKYVLRMVSSVYVGIVRNMPLLVFLFIFYFFISGQIVSFLGLDRIIDQLSGRTISFLSFFFTSPHKLTVFLSAILSLAIYEGAYMTEIVRSGIESVEKGQWEASSALGLSRYQSMKYVVFPQSVRCILPPMAGQLISVIKDSAIVSVISVQDLTFRGMELTASTYRTFEIWITITIMYFCLTSLCSWFVGRLENLMERRGFV